MLVKLTYKTIPFILIDAKISLKILSLGDIFLLKFTDFLNQEILHVHITDCQNCLFNVNSKKQPSCV